MSGWGSLLVMRPAAGQAVPAAGAIQFLPWRPPPLLLLRPLEPFPFSFSLAIIPLAAASAFAVPVGRAVGTRATTLSTSASHVFLFFRAEEAFARVIRARVQRVRLAAGRASAAHL